MGDTNTKRMYYQWVKGQDGCCNPIGDWKEVAEWAFDHFRRVAIGRFKWTLPKEYPKLYSNRARIEKYLFDTGIAVIWKDGDDLIISQATKWGIDEYAEPDHFRPILFNGPMQVDGPVLDLDNCVPIRNTEDYISTFELIYPWVIRYAKAQAVRDNNLMYCNYPMIIKTKNGKDIESRIAGKVMGDLHSMIIQASGSDPLNDLEVINLDVPVLLDQLAYERDRYGNDVLQTLGINTVEQQKRERLITAEADANNERIATLEGVPFELRKTACEEAWDMFEVEINVEKRISTQAYSLPYGEVKDVDIQR